VDLVTRRRFLTLSGVTAATALAAGATQVHWSTLMSAAERNPLDPNAGVLIVVTLYGGNDGLNTVVPATDPAYHAARPELAYQPSEVLGLGDGLGLNPGMTGLKSLWDSGELAVVRGVGYPQPDHSHFRSMAIWQTASPTTSVPTGWLGRWLDATGADPLRAVSVEPVLPPLLAGEHTAAASLPVGGLTLPTGPLAHAFAALGAPQPGEDPWRACTATSISDLHNAVRVLGSAASPHVPSQRPATTRHAGATQVGKPAGAGSELAAQLDVVASLIEAGVPTRVYSVSLSGFDTHANERGTQQRLLTTLEFGRRVRANASQGTDHGTAGPVFLLGTGVRGGFHGTQPSLTDLDNGDLKQTTDFRDVYATVLQGVLGTDPASILSNHQGQVNGLFTT
jgi:uncharacterized protein (DUF1501 family)